MGVYKMKERELPLDGSWDVIVAGGGPAGCAAAAAAAREGARTLLIEATGCLGGMGTSGMVPAFCPFSDKEKIIYKGLAEKVLDLLKKDKPHIPANKIDWVTIDHEHLKRIYDDLVVSAGASVLFNTFICSVDMYEKGRISAVITGNKAGLYAYSAKVYIDCTGDADIAAWAGAEFSKGDDATGEMQPVSTCFTLGNVDEYNYLNTPKPNSIIFDVVRSGKYPLIVDNHLWNALVGPRTVGFNAGHTWDVDNTDPAAVSNALIRGRKIAKEIRDALAEYCPGSFGNAFINCTAALAGARESRRITGDYILTVDDYMHKRKFNDEIGRNSFYLDVHLSKADTALKQAGKLNMKDVLVSYEKGESFGIPYRCLTPKGLSNLLVAGRAISCDRKMQGSIRAMPACLVMGEAAGIASVLAYKHQKNEIDVHKVDTGLLRKRLIEEGAYLPDVERDN